MTSMGIGDKLSLVNALLDEMCDFGHPQITTASLLKEYILEKPLPFDKAANRNMLASKKKTMRDATASATSTISWRKKGVVYKRNELFLDANEKVSALLSKEGEVLYAEVNGAVQMNAKLSGMPECRIGINDKLQMGEAQSARPGVELNALTFHQCVRLSEYEEKREVNFIPPDGEFELIKYRLTDGVSLPFRVLPVLSIGRTMGTLSVKIKSEYAETLTGYNVELDIPLPKNVAKCEVKTSGGRARSLLADHHVVWTIKEFEGGQREHTIDVEFKMVRGFFFFFFFFPRCRLCIPHPPYCLSVQYRHLHVSALTSIGAELNLDCVPYYIYMLPYAFGSHVHVGQSASRYKP